MLQRISKLILAAFCMMAACSFLCGKSNHNGKDVKMNQVLSQPFFVNIIPLDPGNEKRIADMSKEYVKRTGNKIVLYSLALDVEYPAMQKVHYAAESYRKLKQELAGSDVQLGILLQSILGHVPRGHQKFEPWTRTQNIKGQKVRYCVLDQRMQDYITEMVTILAKENPVFIMTDDDCRSFSPKAECFCKLHTAEFNKRMGTNYTDKEYRELVKKSKPGDAVFNAFRKLQEEQVVLTLKTVRKAIDAVNPAIPSGCCLSGWEQPLGHEIVKAIRGKGHPLIMRIGNALYMEYEPKRDFPYIAGKTMAMRQYYPEVDYLLDESDNYPHSLYSRSARNMHAKITASLFFGLNGAKLWMINMHKSTIPMNRKYTDILGANQKSYAELTKVVQESNQTGIIVPSYTKPHDWHPTSYGEIMMTEHNWGEILFSMYGIPWKMSVNRKENAIYALAGAKAVERLTDAEIKDLLSRKILLDGAAATALCKRGFTEYLGVLAEPKKYFANSEVCTTTNFSYAWDRRPEQPLLTIKDPAAKVLTQFMYRRNVADKKRVTAPASVLYKNKLGGMVCITARCIQKYQIQTNTDPGKEYVLMLLNHLNGKPLPYLVQDYQHAPVFSRKLKSGEDVLAIYSLSFDRIDPIHIRCAKKPVSVEWLTPDGKWQKANCEYANNILTVKYGLEFFECLFLKIK